MFKRIDDTTEIDTDFIACAEYQLFLDEMRERGKYYQPDHWTAYTFFETMPKLSATHPLLGVRAEDAETFVIWLNEREKATYRLPTPTEAKEFPTNMENVATWCYENENFTLEGLTKLEYQGIEHRLEKLSTLPLSEHWISLFLSFSNFDNTLDHYRARALVRALDLDLDLDLDLALDLALAFAHARTLARTFARTRALARAHAHAHALALALAHARAHDRIHALALALVKSIDRELYTLLNAKQFDVALSKIQQRQNDSPSIAQQRRLTLLIDLIHCQTATIPNPSGIRQAFRKYAIHLLEYTWIGLNELEKEKTKEQSILENYWQLKIIEAREAGELPAWEGIRLVRVTAEK